MSMQSDLFALLGGTFGGRLYPSVAPYGVTSPYAVYSRITSVEDISLDTNGGTGNAKNTRLQIDIWALTHLECIDKAEAVKTLLNGWSTENTILSEQDDYEPDTKLYRVIIDISIWHF
ncbi:MAG: DUF3168 domain-containing protein [Armatimonadetes bacterium]|nr:DUF3168 domain-containing protein [Armatimonadota bacterium]